MKCALEAIGRLVLSYSTAPTPFEIYPKFNRQTKALADTLVKANFKQLSALVRVKRT